MVFSTQPAWRPPASSKNPIQTRRHVGNRHRIMTTYPESKEQHEIPHQHKEESKSQIETTQFINNNNNPRERVTEGCLCEVCTCGHHHCKTYPVNEHYHNIKTESQARFDLPTDYLAKTQSCKPSRSLVPLNTKFDDVTMYKQEYHPWNLKDAHRNTSVPKYGPEDHEGSAPFYDETTNLASHTQLSLAAAKRQPYKTYQSPFQRQSKSEYMTEHNAAYHPHPLPKRAPKKQQILPQSERFYGESTSSHDFVPYDGSHRRITCCPDKLSENSVESRTFETEHSTQYVQHALQRCPAIFRRQTAKTVCKRRMPAK